MKETRSFWKAVSAVLLLGVIFFAGPMLIERRSAGMIVEGAEITVFYSPGCSCCVQYIPYLKRKGFIVTEELDYGKRIDILEENGIPAEMTSCHVSTVGGYFIEGHVPAEVIADLLEERPDIDGIVLPGMPQGTPGMPGIKNDIWRIHGFKDGRSFEYLNI